MRMQTMFQKRLHEALRMRNMTHQDLASFAGVTVGEVHLMSKGYLVPGEDILFRLARALGVSVPWLRGDF